MNSHQLFLKELKELNEHIGYMQANVFTMLENNQIHDASKMEAEIGYKRISIEELEDKILASKKKFFLEAIAPYYYDSSICGFNKSNLSEHVGCRYLTKDGKKCVAGKYLLEPEKYVDSEKCIDNILSEYDLESAPGSEHARLKGQEHLFVPEACDILDTSEWELLQSIHDKLAINHYTSEDTKESCVHQAYVRLKGCFFISAKEVVDYCSNYKPE